MGVGGIGQDPREAVKGLEEALSRGERGLPRSVTRRTDCDGLFDFLQ